eukprot:2906467-Rhodomonas_salina.1
MCQLRAHCDQGSLLTRLRAHYSPPTGLTAPRTHYYQGSLLRELTATSAQGSPARCPALRRRRQATVRAQGSPSAPPRPPAVLYRKTADQILQYRAKNADQILQDRAKNADSPVQRTRRFCSTAHAQIL